MKRLWKTFISLVSSGYISLACQESLPSKTSSTSFTQKHLGEIPHELWPSLEPKLLSANWLEQRHTAWNLQAWLFARKANAFGSNLPDWQKWYDVNELRLLFRDLYQGLGKDGRAARQAFSAEAMAQRFLRAFELKNEQQTPRLTHILLNETAARELIEHYADWEQCFRSQDCQNLKFPKGAAFLKSAWRRSSQDYTIPAFPTDPSAFLAQLAAPEWQAEGSIRPDPQKIYRISTESGVAFHLVGLHLMVKLSEDWFWTTLWLGQEASQDFAADAPQHNELPYYRMCSIYGFESPLQASTAIADELAIAPVAKVLQSLSDAHWCSNPFLEHGANNHKTQCIGCHQWAGSFLSQADIAERLQNDLPSLLTRQSQQGPSDFVWSLLRGSQPLFLAIMESIDYFDAYDPLESLAD